MGRHFSSSSQPLFIFIQTMSPHGPHTWKFAPELDVPVGGPGTAPDISEYLRRVWIAKLDYEYLISELKSKFPNQKLLVVHYGDHHPLTTRPLIGLVDQIGAPGSPEFLNYVLDTVLSPDSVGMRTYYAAIGLNYTVPSMPDLDIIDAVYLGQIVLKLAGLPLSEAQQERERFMMLCKGRYFSCPERRQILEFHRRLINSGLLIQ
jgi:hypothetical protein